MSAKLTELNTLRTTQIIDIKSENGTVKTFTVKDKLGSKAKPGQFIMLWIPGVDEIPISVLQTNNDEVSFSVKAVGDATRYLHRMKTGENVGIRGPFGSHFTESHGRVLLVGGGTGIAPLLFLAKKIASKTKHLSFVVGAKTKEEVLFLKELGSVCLKENLIATTEDGTYGIKCLATEPVDELTAKHKFDMIYTCGPELMMRKVFDVAEKHKITLEASLERLMRCGIGLCGSCVIGKYRVCCDGPVFKSAQLREVKNEFGFSRLGFDGSRIQP
ncbi:MAG: dihydroorotate dehydrogenase electron transfer subunit [Candidatus Bathyarchaeota archaeon]|nr:dihydroorotate dehydrogenase electron transfer subunit [Candidatus Bathyarchaeota archaeon]